MPRTLLKRNFVDGLAGEGEPEREQHAGHHFAAQVDGDLAEVNLRFSARSVGLREEHVDRSPAGLDADLRLAVGDVGAHYRVGHLVHVVVGDQTVVDPLDGVPLFAGCVQVRAQDVVDDRLERVQLRGPRRHRLARLRSDGYPIRPFFPSVLDAAPPMSWWRARRCIRA